MRPALALGRRCPNGEGRRPVLMPCLLRRPRRHCERWRRCQWWGSFCHLPSHQLFMPGARCRVRISRQCLLALTLECSGSCGRRGQHFLKHPSRARPLSIQGLVLIGNFGECDVAGGSADQPLKLFSILPEGKRPHQAAPARYELWRYAQLLAESVRIGAPVKNRIEFP